MCRDGASVMASATESGVFFGLMTGGYRLTVAEKDSRPRTTGPIATVLARRMRYDTL